VQAGGSVGSEASASEKFNWSSKPDNAQTRRGLTSTFSLLLAVVSPVVTEVNLNAVRRNRNQFDQDEVKQEGEWIVYQVPEGGFKRYRVIEQKDKHYLVEYQDNGGGTLTTSSRIGFSLERREILVNGRPKVINTLRVSSYSR
jgi:hypothetical protein